MIKEWLNDPATSKISSILEKHNIKGKVLGIGSSPQDKDVLNLPYFSNNPNDFDLTGINVSGDFRTHNKFKIIMANAHNIPFVDDYFDIVMCNCMLEHDREFWLTLAEVRRVLRDDGIFIVNMPVFVDIKTEVKNATYTYEVHGNDYYRFSKRTMEEVVFANMKDVYVESLLIPPLMVGCGKNSKIKG